MGKIKIKNKTEIVLALYGIMTALVISVIYINFFNDYEDSFMPFRIQEFSAYMDYFAGKTAFISPDHNASYFWYMALFAKICGITDAKTVYYLIQVLANAIILSAYPLLFNQIFNNRLVGIIAPFLYCLGFGIDMFYLHWDCYWAHGWCIALGMPLLLLFLNKLREQMDWKLLLMLAAVLGIGNVPRMHASLPVLVISFIGGGLTLYHSNIDSKSKVLRYAVTLFVLMAGYFMFINIIPSIYMKVTGGTGMIANVPPWHTIYIGFGFENNPYGIIYSDSCAIDFVKSIDPDAAFYSPEYLAILRDEVFRLWKSNPTYFVGSYFRKIIRCIANVMFWGKQTIAVGMIGNVYIYIVRRKDRKILLYAFLAFLIVFLINMIFPLMSIPDKYSYLLGMLCSLDFYGVWVAAYAIKIFFEDKRIKS